MKTLVLLAAAVIAGTCEAQLEARVRTDEAGVPHIEVNGKKIPPRMFFGRCRLRPEWGSWTEDVFTNQVKIAAESGVDIVSFIVPGLCWADEEKYDWSIIDSQFDCVLKANPKALVLPRVLIDRTTWWHEKYPDDVCTYDDGEKSKAPSVASRKYRELAKKYLTAVVRHLMEKYPENFFGIHPTGQETGEFFYPASWWKPFSGYDPASREAFKKWLVAHGKSAADVPDPKTRWAAYESGNVFADPKRDELLMDFRRFQQEDMADFVGEICAACRKASEGKKIVMCFYGYQWELSLLSKGPATSGHFALWRLLEKHDRDIDILCSPYSYVDRGPEGTGPIMSAAETVMRHGVMWLMEDDARTHLVDPDKCCGCSIRCKDLEETLKVLRRNDTMEIERGYASWYMDLGGAGWYGDPKIWAVRRELAAADRAALDRNRAYEPEIAVIVDEQAMLYASTSRFVKDVVAGSRYPIGRTGKKLGQYLMDDILKRPLTTKMQIFLSAWCMTPETRAAVEEQRRRFPGVIRVWCLAPGYLSPTGADIAGVEKLTGFRVKRVDEQLGGMFGVEPTSEDEIIDRYSDGTPSIVLRRNIFGGAEVFYGPAQLDEKQLLKFYKTLKAAKECRRPGAFHARQARRHQGIPSVAISRKNGRMWSTYYAGPSAGEDRYCCQILATSADNGKTWKEVLVADPDEEGPERTFDGQLWIAPDGKLRWTWTQRTNTAAEFDVTLPYAGTEGDPKTDRLMMVELDAENEPAADVVPWRQIARGVMMGKPIVLKDGTWLFPTAWWNSAPSSVFYATTDGGRTFQVRGGATIPPEQRLYDEEVVVEKRNGDLVTFIRGAWGEKGHPWMSVSHDGGRTWEKSVHAPFEHTSSRLFVRKLESGNWLLVKNGWFGLDTGRTSLVAYLSRDEGETWSKGILIDDRDSVSYPDGDQRADGTIVITYDRNRLTDKDILFKELKESDFDTSRPLIRVACIGDSITYGYAMTNRLAECYPKQLQELLGGGYEVRNFGDPGAGAYMHLKSFDGKGPRAWRLRGNLEKVLAFKPDIVISNLGINDAREYGKELEVDPKTGKNAVAPGTFRRDYLELLKTIAANGKPPRFIIWTKLGPCVKGASLAGSKLPFAMEADLKAVAQAVNATELDMYSPLLPLAETAHFCRDGVHPEGGACSVIARETASLILR